MTTQEKQEKQENRENFLDKREGIFYNIIVLKERKSML